MKRPVRAPSSRRRDIEAAIEAYNATDPDMLLPLEAARLLAVMFRRSSVCQRTVASLAAETSDTIRIVARLLRMLVEAGFLSKERRLGAREHRLGAVANVYRLHLPRLVRR
jgi:hypothetical protein